MRHLQLAHGRSPRGPGHRGRVPGCEQAGVHTQQAMAEHEPIGSSGAEHHIQSALRDKATKLAAV